MRTLLPCLTSLTSVPALLTLACSAGDLELPSDGPALSTTQITSVTPEPSFPAQPVTIGVTVASSSGTPSGTVTVTDGTVSCTASAPTGQCSLAPMAAGSMTLTATYSGSVTFAESSDTTQHQVIPAATSATLSSSLNPSVRGQLVTFTAGVTSAFSPPTGSVRFVEGSCTTPTTTWNTSALDGTGQASFSTDNLSPGTHTMFACYLGNDTFAPSTSNELQQRVTKDEHR